MDLPPEKTLTDFKLCIICQDDTGEKLVNTAYRTFKDTAYESILKGLFQKREQYYIDVKNRLGNISHHQS